MLIRTTILLHMVSLTVWGCSDEKKFGGASKVQSGPSKEEVKTADAGNEKFVNEAILDESTKASGTWLWPCETAEQTPAEDNSQYDFIFNADEENVIGRNISELTLNIKGSLCQPDIKFERDIVLIVDISGSMKKGFPIYSIPPADPVDGQGNCQREAAVTSLTEFLGQGPEDTQLALVTFAGGVAADSNGFSSPADFKEMYVNKKRQGATDDFLCEGLGKTFYDEAFEAAIANVVNHGRKDATKNFFFITDGLPSVPMEQVIPKVESARELGTVATIFLGSSAEGNQLLSEQVASKQKDGSPFHANAKEASELAKILSDFAEKTVTSVTFKYRSIGSEKWSGQETLTPSKDGFFERPELRLQTSEYQGGIEFSYDYQHSDGKTFSRTGQIKFKDK